MYSKWCCALYVCGTACCRKKLIFRGTMTEETINEIQWTIHTTNPELVQLTREKLAEVVEPEIGMNIIQLRLVRDITVDNGVGHLKMILTAPFCPYGPAM